MDSSYDRPEYNTYGVQTFIAPSANQSLSGFEEYSALADPALYEAALSSGHSYNPTYTTSGYSPALHHHLSSGALRSPHGTYIHLSVSVVNAMFVSQLRPSHATISLLLSYYWPARFLTRHGLCFFSFN